MIKAIWAWTCDPKHKWRSWVAHAIIVIGLAAVFGIRPAVFCYCFREAEQALVKHIEGKSNDPADNLLDVVVPLVALAPIALLFGWR